MSAQDGGPAFPSSARQVAPNIIETITNGGMSLRDWFAGQTLAGITANSTTSAPPVDLARAAFLVADAMLAARAAAPPARDDGRAE